MLSTFLVLWAGCGDEPATGADAAPEPDAIDDASPTPDGDALPAPDVLRNDPGLGLCRFDPHLPWSPMGEVLQLASARGHTCVWLQRRDECEGICKAVPFTLEIMRIGHDGAVVEIDDPAALSWHSTHHNWCDDGEALTDSTRYLLQVRLTDSFEHYYMIRAFERATNTELWNARMAPFQPSGSTRTGLQPAPAHQVEVHACNPVPAISAR